MANPAPLVHLHLKLNRLRRFMNDLLTYCCDSLKTSVPTQIQDCCRQRRRQCSQSRHRRLFPSFHCRCNRLPDVPRCLFLPPIWHLNISIQLNQIKSNQIYFSLAWNNNTQYKSIHIKIWHSATIAEKFSFVSHVVQNIVEMVDLAQFLLYTAPWPRLGVPQIFTILQREVVY